MLYSDLFTTENLLRYNCNILVVPVSLNYNEIESSKLSSVLGK